MQDIVARTLDALHDKPDAVTALAALLPKQMNPFQSCPGTLWESWIEIQSMYPSDQDVAVVLDFVRNAEYGNRCVVCGVGGGDGFGCDAPRCSLRVHVKCRHVGVDESEDWFCPDHRRS